MINVEVHMLHIDCRMANAIIIINTVVIDRIVYIQTYIRIIYVPISFRWSLRFSFLGL